MTESISIPAWCTHRLTIEVGDWATDDRWRLCLTCGYEYNRTALLKRLERAIRDRYRLPHLRSYT